MNQEKPSDLDVNIDTTLGPAFKNIYNEVLFKSIKEYVPHLYSKWQESEADRAARLQVIEEQGRRLGEVEAERNNLRYQLEDIMHQFEISEADRAARLQVIEEQGRRLGEVEADIKQKCAQLCKLDDDLKSKCCELNDKEGEIRAIKLSLGWRITAPLRAVCGLLKRDKK